jgi:hypothetical protein
MTAEELEVVTHVFGGEDVLSPTDIGDYFDVISGAYAVHIDRERIRRGLWKEYPAMDQFNQVKIKVDRVLRSLEFLAEDQRDPMPRQQNIAEEGFDIVNYSVFGVRILKGKI